MCEHDCEITCVRTYSSTAPEDSADSVTYAFSDPSKKALKIELVIGGVIR